MSSSQQTDEIDLLELLAKFIRIIRRNTLIILAAFIIGTLLGLCYYQFVPKTYESKMVVTSEILTESYSRTLFDNLERLMNEGNAPVLAQKLGIDEGTAARISSVKIKSAIEKADGLLEEKKTYLTIEARSGDNSIWPTLQSGIVRYLGNNDFVTTRVEQKRKSHTELIKRIDHELADLDALKAKVMENSQASNGKGNLVLIDPTEINFKIVELTKLKLETETLLALVNSVHVVDGFTAFRKPASPKLSFSLAAGASFGLFFVALVIAFKGIRGMLRFSEEKLGKV